MSYKLVGIEYGNYEGNNWARAHILEELNRESGIGYRAVRDREKKAIKIDYSLALQIVSDWDLYKDQLVFVSLDLRGRIDRLELVN